MCSLSVGFCLGERTAKLTARSGADVTIIALQLSLMVAGSAELLAHPLLILCDANLCFVSVSCSTTERY